MHRVLLVDDEPWVVYGIKHLIDWEATGYRIIGEAYNGLDALNIIRQSKPEIIISDIRMPGLNGIELIETLRQEHIDAKVIFISGYAEFDYAKRALQLGASEYLLKQVEEAALRSALDKVSAELAREAGLHTDASELTVDELFEILESAYPIKVHNFVSQKGVADVFPHYRLITCLFPEGLKHKATPEASGVEGIHRFHFRTGKNKHSYLLNFDERQNPLPFLDTVAQLKGHADHIGISSLGSYSTPIRQLFIESDIACRQSFINPGKGVTEYKQTDRAEQTVGQILELEIAVKERHAARIKRMMNEFLALMQDQAWSAEEAARLYNQMVSIAYKHVPDNSGTIGFMDYDQMTRAYESLEQLLHHVGALLQPQSGSHYHISNDMIRSIIAYIDDNYAQELTLSDLSRKFSVSLGYLSSMVKKETGITFTEYVTGKRIRLAKELLCDPSLTIEEIVHKIGYKDYFHFNKLFKKIVGVPPGKFKRL
ncbi:response regulator [Paenibacillaceae bacterium]|nr:response regulator [Paenibacillaceae bacterium]